MFSIDIKLPELSAFNVSPPTASFNTTPHFISLINPNIQLLRSNCPISPQIYVGNVQINVLRSSIINDLPCPTHLSDFKTSITYTHAQLHSHSKAQCISDCNGTVRFNNQIQCGIPNAITGLIAQEPDMTRCVLNLQQSKTDCLNACNKLNN